MVKLEAAWDIKEKVGDRETIIWVVLGGCYHRAEKFSFSEFFLSLSENQVPITNS